MTQFVAKNGMFFEGHRLVGDPDEIDLVVGWIAAYGLPLLRDPTPAVEGWTPARMVDSQNKRHTPGVYIHPKKGLLVIRNRYKQTLEGDYGDWVFRDMVSSNFFIVKQSSIENGTYATVSE